MGGRENPPAPSSATHHHHHQRLLSSAEKPLKVTMKKNRQDKKNNAGMQIIERFQYGGSLRPLWLKTRRLTPRLAYLSEVRHKNGPLNLSAGIVCGGSTPHQLLLRLLLLLLLLLFVVVGSNSSADSGIKERTERRRSRWPNRVRSASRPNPVRPNKSR